MIITKILGGLGNQMFQYATGLALAKAKHTELKVDLSGFEKGLDKMVTLRNYELEVFEKTIPLATTEEISPFIKRSKNKLFRALQRFFPFLFKTVYFSESGSDVHSTFFKCPEDTYLDGYWQSETYFREFETEVRAAFEFKKDITDSVKDISRQMKISNSVSIHVRRGDYLKLSHVYELCSPEYYEKAVTLLYEKLQGNMRLFIFSDDIEWCRENLKFPADLHFVQTDDPGKDLFLMSQCKHHIIANSSYSWWGAWLNAGKDKIVIAPEKWYRYKDSPDIYPQNWITL